MNTLSYKTKSITPVETARKWYIVDAENQTLGRISSEIAKILQGKNKPSYTPNIDTGDHVIIINAEKVHLSGKKLTDKVYIRHTGYPGGQRFATPKEMMAKHPTAMIEMGVRGMLPKNRLGRQLYKKLFVYKEDTHPHTAQKPKAL
mgnify:CR=1 FL=1